MIRGIPRVGPACADRSFHCGCNEPLSPTSCSASYFGHTNQSLMTRRAFLSSLTTFSLLGPAALGRSADQLQCFDGQDVFTRIVNKALAEKWNQLPIGELIGKIALELKGTPYVGFTLERSADAEYCVVNLEGLDCVTFFEDSLCMARILKRGKSSPEALLNEVQTTRYRGGR